MKTNVVECSDGRRPYCMDTFASVFTVNFETEVKKFIEFFLFPST